VATVVAPKPKVAARAHPSAVPATPGVVTPKSTMLILVDSTANSNKFYRMSLATTGVVTTTYGRVGAAGVTNEENLGAAGYDRILREKLRKGYKEIEVADDSGTPRRLANLRLASVAKSGLTSDEAAQDAAVSNLIDRIVRVNAHDIFETSGGLIKVDTSGRIKTPVGLVTTSSIREAELLLNKMQRTKATDRPPLLERYLTFVPQKVSAKSGWADTFFAGTGAFQKQRDFLEQLRESVAFYEAQAVALADSADQPIDATFKYRIRAVPSKDAVYKRIQVKYESTKNDMHSASKLKLKRVFELVDPAGEKAYTTIVGQIRNEQELWHGTRAANLLSILRRGLYVPPPSGTTVQIAGRMFGDGVYLSSQSSKALNYSHGFWTSGGRDNNCFMLLSDVAMGSEYRPGQNWDANIPVLARTTRNKFGKSWNSINVRPGHGGVRNHEAIVWNTDQIRVRYLCEFDS
jgi:poly [ADP-ribose] polymerase